MMALENLVFPNGICTWARIIDIYIQGKQIFYYKARSSNERGNQQFQSAQVNPIAKSKKVARSRSFYYKL
jgi:hypothetical protein